MKNSSKWIIRSCLISFILIITMLTGVGTQAGEESLVLTEIGQFIGIEKAVDVQIVGNVAYVVDLRNGLKIVDITDSTNLSLVGAYHKRGYTHNVVVDGDRAYMSETASGLAILDVRDPTNPTKLGQFTESRAINVDVVGDIVYVPGHNEGLHIINVTDPSNPTTLGQYSEGGVITSVCVAEDIAYVDQQHPDNFSLMILDVSDPTNPIKLGQYDREETSSPYVVNIQIIEDIAYVANWLNGLEIFNISDPTNPIKLGQYNSYLGNTMDVQVVGEVAYISDGIEGLKILDVSDPKNITEVGAFKDGAEAFGIYVVEDIVYVADGSDGLEVIKVEREIQNASGWTVLIFGTTLMAILLIRKNKQKSN